jgi:dTMP kinase
MPRGLFITLEGGEGAGKTTQIRRLKARLEEAGRKVVVTREPGGSTGAEAIRKLLVEGEASQWSPLTETLLLYAARRDHVEKVIEPALARGDVVICDRFYDSTTAYQGYGQGLDIKVIRNIRRLSIGNLKPHITFLLDLPVEEGLKRAAVQQRYEKMGEAFHKKLRKGFLALAKLEPKRIRKINAAQSMEKVEAAMWKEIRNRL